ncbi:MAG TPA: biotin/lipoyl-binding protein [Steroidobacteraceae bacterium]|jgi:HlyD family secretion protein|nr:biotin/lipoyl-binding protein [Steroidobacteraceae bacterium]
MRNKVIFIASGVGLLLALVSAFIFSQQPKPQPPVFRPAANPYAHGIYSDGIIESSQAQGENINIYPEVAGPITRILVQEGQQVRRGDALLTLDDSVQRATAGQQQAQAEAAHAMLRELRAEPRREALAVSLAQVDNARATLKNARDQLAKQQRSYDIDPKSISADALDNAVNAEKIAATNLEVIERQYQLTEAGAWSYDVQNAERTYAAQQKAADSAAALLAKYTLRAPADGVVMAVNSSVGSYVSSQGAYDSYTQGYGPLIVMGLPQDHLQVRAYIDEILVHELPSAEKMQAQMFVRGTSVHLPLTFVRIQPYVSPKIELSDAREERVDLRVLPIVFRFDKPRDLNLYPGQLVDVYVGAK